MRSARGYAHPDGLARTILWLIDGVCVLGFLGAAIWMVIHFQRRQRWASLPALWLSGTMLLFQNLRYFFYPPRPHYIDTHNIFWLMFVFMVVYAIFARPQPVELLESSSGEFESRWPALGRLMIEIAAAGIVVFLAGFADTGSHRT